MSPVVLVDTSSWTQALRRKGDPLVRDRVGQLLTNNSAAWCDMVRVELWNGARGLAERDKLKQMEAELPRLPITDDVWELACRCAGLAHATGLVVPASDLVIFACAKVHGAGIECTDRHFQMLEQLKFSS